MGIKIRKITDSSFRKYGRVLTKEYNLKDLIEVMEETVCPEEVVYVPSYSKAESLTVMKVMTDSAYGGLPIQIGYCNGHNQYLNAVEYHKSSEIDIACSDLILLLGLEADITEEFTYHSENIEAFLVPKGEMVELYGTTLHYAPCGVEGAGFRCVIILPKGTNLEIANKPTGAIEDNYLTAQNKWLIAHEKAQIQGAINGIIGSNIKV